MTETACCHVDLQEGVAFWHQPQVCFPWCFSFFHPSASFSLQFVQLCLTITAGSPWSMQGRLHIEASVPRIATPTMYMTLLIAQILQAREATLWHVSASDSNRKKCSSLRLLLFAACSCSWRHTRWIVDMFMLFMVLCSCCRESQQSILWPATCHMESVRQPP